MRLIDCLHLGRERVIGCWQVGEVLVDPGPSSCLPTLLGALGDGARGRCCSPTSTSTTPARAARSSRAGPDLEVYVHERGARHMVDPTKLIDSATRLYGDDMDRLWGEFLPVPEDRSEFCRAASHCRCPDGEFEVQYTPGHASHHVSYL